MNLYTEYREYKPLSDSRYVPHIILIDRDKKTPAKNTGGMTIEQLRALVKPFVK